VLAVPLDFLRRFAVEHEAVRTTLLVLHLTRDVVTAAELVAETLALTVEHEATNAAEGLGSEELKLSLRLLGVNETGGVDLKQI